MAAIDTLTIGDLDGLTIAGLDAAVILGGLLDAVGMAGGMQQFTGGMQRI